MLGCRYSASPRAWSLAPDEANLAHERRGRDFQESSRTARMRKCWRSCFLKFFEAPWRAATKAWKFLPLPVSMKYDQVCFSGVYFKMSFCVWRKQSGVVSWATQLPKEQGKHSFWHLFSFTQFPTWQWMRSLCKCHFVITLCPLLSTKFHAVTVMVNWSFKVLRASSILIWDST